MATIKINMRTAKGKALFEFLRLFEGEGFIEIVREPKSSLLKSIEEAKTGKTKEMKNIEGYFNELRSKTTFK